MWFACYGHGACLTPPCCTMVCVMPCRPSVRHVDVMTKSVAVCALPPHHTVCTLPPHHMVRHRRCSSAQWTTRGTRTGSSCPCSGGHRQHRPRQQWGSPIAQMPSAFLTAGGSLLISRTRRSTGRHAFSPLSATALATGSIVSGPVKDKACTYHRVLRSPRCHLPCSPYRFLPQMQTLTAYGIWCLQ